MQKTRHFSRTQWQKPAFPQGFKVLNGKKAPFRVPEREIPTTRVLTRFPRDPGTCHQHPALVFQGLRGQGSQFQRPNPPPNMHFHRVSCAPQAQNLHFHVVLESSIAKKTHFNEVLERGFPEPALLRGFGVPNRKNLHFYEVWQGSQRAGFPVSEAHPPKHAFSQRFMHPPRPKHAFSWGHGVLN